MEVIYKEDGNLLLVAETEFERSFLQTLDNYSFMGTIKTGLSAADVVGLRLSKQQKHDVKK